VPLAETVGEALGVGPGSRRVRDVLERLLTKLGPELVVLRHSALADIARVGGALVAEAVRRVREGQLKITAGYDGEFGTVRIFDPAERQRFRERRSRDNETERY
jgi:PHP family Zn ribbon phosphoesterase